MIEMGGFIKLARSDMDAAGAQMAAGDFMGALTTAEVIKVKNCKGADKFKYYKGYG